jgi:hypothetical protein
MGKRSLLRKLPKLNNHDQFRRMLRHGLKQVALQREKPGAGPQKIKGILRKQTGSRPNHLIQ